MDEFEQLVSCISDPDVLVVEGWMVEDYVVSSVSSVQAAKRSFLKVQWKRARAPSVSSALFGFRLSFPQTFQLHKVESFA